MEKDWGAKCHDMKCKQRDFLENGVELIDRRETWLLQSNGRNIILFDVYFGKLLNFNTLCFIMFQYTFSFLKNVEIRRVQIQRLKFQILHIFLIFNLKIHQGPPHPQHIHNALTMLHPPFLNFVGWTKPHRYGLPHKFTSHKLM